MGTFSADLGLAVDERAETEISHGNVLGRGETERVRDDGQSSERLCEGSDFGVGDGVH